MADNRINMPSSQGGLVRYSEDYKSKINLKPEHVIIVIIAIILIELFLHSYGKSMLGM